MLCKSCDHEGVCSVRQKMEERTLMEFPDGKAAVFNMEDALVSCDHHKSSVQEPRYIGGEDEIGDAYLGAGASSPEPPAPAPDPPLQVPNVPPGLPQDVADQEVEHVPVPPSLVQTFHGPGQAPTISHDQQSAPHGGAPPPQRRKRLTLTNMPR